MEYLENKEDQEGILTTDVDVLCNNFNKFNVLIDFNKFNDLNEDDINTLINKKMRNLIKNNYKNEYIRFKMTTLSLIFNSNNFESLSEKVSHISYLYYKAKTYNRKIRKL